MLSLHQTVTMRPGVESPLPAPETGTRWRDLAALTAATSLILAVATIVALAAGIAAARAIIWLGIL